MTPHDLTVKFFTEHLGWEYVGNLPKVATSWDAFREYVVPVLRSRAKAPTHLERIESVIGILFCTNKTPQRAFEWAMEEMEG